MGKHRDPAFELMTTQQQRAFEGRLRAEERSRRARERTERAMPRPQGDLGLVISGSVEAALDEGETVREGGDRDSEDRDSEDRDSEDRDSEDRDSEDRRLGDRQLARLVDELWQQIGTALRARRAQLGLSQRDLAISLGVSQSALARLEAASGASSLAAALQVLAAVGVRLAVVQPARPTRGAGEHARDQAGRRLPAHLTVYRLSQPHDWWAGTTDARMWRDEPRWSFRRRD